MAPVSRNQKELVVSGDIDAAVVAPLRRPEHAPGWRDEAVVDEAVPFLDRQGDHLLARGEIPLQGSEGERPGALANASFEPR